VEDERSLKTIMAFQSFTDLISNRAYRNRLQKRKQTFHSVRLVCIWIVQAVLRNTVPKNTIPLIIQEITGLVLRIIAAGFLVSRGIEILLDKRISGHMQVFGISFHIFCRDGSAIVLAAVPASAAVIPGKQFFVKPEKLRIQVIRIRMHFQP
jgi:hypothetical protein